MPQVMTLLLGSDSYCEVIVSGDVSSRRPRMRTTAFLMGAADFEKIAAMLSRFFDIELDSWNIEERSIVFKPGNDETATITVLVSGEDRTRRIQKIHAPLWLATVTAFYVAGVEAARRVWHGEALEVRASSASLEITSITLERLDVSKVLAVDKAVNAGGRLARSYEESINLTESLFSLSGGLYAISRAELVVTTRVYTLAGFRVYSDDGKVLVEPPSILDELSREPCVNVTWYKTLRIDATREAVIKLYRFPPLRPPASGLLEAILVTEKGVKELGEAIAEALMASEKRLVVKLVTV